MSREWVGASTQGLVMILASSASFGVGCSSETSRDGWASENIEATTQAVVNGSLDDVPPFRYPFVGHLTTPAVGSLTSDCTATLLSCGAAITAAHCTRGVWQGQKWATGLGTIDISADSNGTSYEYDQVYVPGEWDEAPTLPTDYQRGRDVAILRLKGGISAASKIALQSIQGAVIAPPSSVVEGDFGMVVGYGPGGSTENAICIHDNRRRYAPMQVSMVADWLEAVGQNEGQSLGIGDSGGPLFLSDTRSIVGVVSAGNNSDTNHCDATVGFYANLTSQSTATWIRSTLSLLDRDGDGVPDACDVCPLDFEASGPSNSPDSDGDLIPDVCDEFPCDPSNDSDKDNFGACDPTLQDQQGRNAGFCADYCARAVVDNCPTQNDQKNCNLEAELSNDAEILGDACDPVPCAAGTPKIRTVGAVHVSTRFFDAEIYTQEVAGFDIRKVGPTAWRLDKNGGVVDSAAYRYCDPNFRPDKSVDCRTKQAIRDDYLLTALSQERDTTIWHQVTTVPNRTMPDAVDMSDNARDFRCTRLVSGDVISTTCNDSYSIAWQMPLDFARWNRLFGAPALSTFVRGRGTPDYDARFLFHANTAVGMTDPTWGAHHRLDGSIGESLANSVVPVVPRETWSNIHGEGRPLPTIIRPLARYRDCWMCIHTVDEVAQRVNPPFEHQDAEVFVLASMALPDGMRYGLLSPTGGLWDMTDSFEPMLRDRLANPSLLWVSPAEAEPLIGKGSSHPGVVAVSSDGTTIADRLAWVGGQFTGTQVVDVIDRTPLYHSAEAIPIAPLPRSGFAPVYVRSRGRLYVVGGVDPSSQTPTGDIWSANVNANTWVRVTTTGYGPEKVFASTWSIADGRLWILDEVRQNRMALARLARVDPETGDVQEVGRWPRLGLYNRYWLATDSAGRVIVAASSHVLRSYMMLRLDGSAEKVRIDGFRVGIGELDSAPVVDSTGVRILSAKGSIVRLPGDGFLPIPRARDLFSECMR